VYFLKKRAKSNIFTSIMPSLGVPPADRKMVEILALVFHHDERVVLASVELASQAGMPSNKAS